jgi:hypothetical protein
MKFTDNQKSIFKQFTYFSQSLSLEELIKKHFADKNIIVEKPRDTMRIDIPHYGGVNNREEIKDIVYVWNFIQENKLAYCEKITSESPNYHIFTKENLIETGHPDLRILLRPFWNTRLTQTLALLEFIDNGYKTRDDIKLEEEREAREKEREINETRLKEERRGRLVANGLTLLAVLASVGLGIYNSYQGTTVKDIKRVSDTVKVMYYNPPKDTAKIR